MSGPRYRRWLASRRWSQWALQPLTATITAYAGSPRAWPLTMFLLLTFRQIFTIVAAAIFTGVLAWVARDWLGRAFRRADALRPAKPLITLKPQQREGRS
jgi:hypothetical protein